MTWNIITYKEYLNEATGLYIDKENKEIVVQFKSAFDDVETVCIELPQLKELVATLEK